MKQPVLYIIQGFLAAGKTVFSRKLAAETGVVRLNADEWCEANFSKEQLDADWDACFAHAVGHLWQVAEGRLKAGQDVIFDMGFWDRASRDHARQRAAACRAAVAHYYLDTPDDVLLHRLRVRAEEGGAVAATNIRKFHELKKYFEAPHESEAAIFVKHEGDGRG